MPARQPPDSVCRYVLLTWDYTVGYPFRVTSDEDIGSKLQHVWGRGGGVLEERTVTLCLGARLGQDCRS